MFTMQPNALVELYKRANREIHGQWHGWAMSALAAISMTAPKIRRLKNRDELMRTMLHMVGQCVTLGDRDISPEDLEVYKREEVESILDALDSVIIDALGLFGIKQHVLPTLDRWQAEQETFFTPENWPQIREWWVKVLT